MTMKGSKMNLSFGSEIIYEDAEFLINDHDKAGIVGVNGAGKTTLFHVLMHELELDSGTISTGNSRIACLPQEIVIHDETCTVLDYLQEGRPIRRLEADLSRIYQRLEHAAVTEHASLLKQMDKLQTRLEFFDCYKADSILLDIIDRMQIDIDLLDMPINRLSGGQKSKIAFARVLYSKADILLLDEPTNYLDEEHINWLKRYLTEYENAFILISHDIPFLDEVVNIIYHMENQSLDRYVGNYEDFQRVYEVKKSQLEAAYKRQQQEISQLKDFVARNKARVSTRNMAMSRQKKLDKMDVIELAAERPKPEFHFKQGRTPGKYIFETKDFVIGYDEPLSKPLDISLERGQKIALTGANGIGKTTLIRSIMGLVKPLKGSCELGENLSVGYFEQEGDGNNRTTCIEEIWSEFPSFTQYEVRSALAKCGLTTKHIESQVRVLSGGEQAKVRLCKLINRENNVLMLDEPTNHLDVEAKEALKEALKEYRGTILLICHEPEFYQDIVQEVWDCTRWTTRVV